STIKDLPNKEEIVLNPVKRMQTLFDGSNISIETVSDIPIERFIQKMNDMFDMGEAYLEERQIEKAAVIFLRYVTVNLEVLPNHKAFAFLDYEVRNGINERANRGMDHTNNIKEVLGRLYEEESMRLFNDVINKSQFGDLALKKFADGATSLGDIVKDIRQLEQEEATRMGNRLGLMMQAEPKPEKTLAIPLDLVDKYKAAVGEDDCVGVLFGTNPRLHYYVVSHVLLPGKQHTGWNAEKFFHRMHDEVSSSLGLIPLGLIHKCSDYFVCRRLKCRPTSEDGRSPADASTDHPEVYSACPHLFAQALYQTINPFAVTIIAHPRAENQCVWMTPAGLIVAARRSLYNGEVTGRADHAKMAESISATVIDLRGTESEMKMEEVEPPETIEDSKENINTNPN
ncbi:hypothetical protein PFISCL1PPCAC_14876, partial [Pristionchus fissidentatus]